MAWFIFAAVVLISIEISTVGKNIVEAIVNGRAPVPALTLRIRTEWVPTDGTWKWTVTAAGHPDISGRDVTLDTALENARKAMLGAASQTAWPKKGKGI